MTFSFPKLIGFVFLCELVGLAGTPFTVSAIPTWYAHLSKPFFSPPNWLFGPVWTALYALMGISLYLIWQKGIQKPKVKQAVMVFGVQLFLNFMWSVLFFGLRDPLLGLIGIFMLASTIILTIELFYPLSKWSAYLLLPYIAWVGFATLLNAGIFFLN